MRYYLRGGIEIRSENSAKPHQQTSIFVEEQIRTLKNVEHSLNYGAGKLRFLNAMLDVSQRLTILDSTTQMTRKQCLLGSALINYNDAIKGWNSIDLMSIAQLIKQPPSFDRIYCLNVLAVIPFPAIRRQIFVRAFNKLKPGGELIIVNRWRNSEFSQMRKSEHASQLNGGTLIKSFRGYGYYYEMKPDEAERLASKAGFVTQSVKRKDGSYFSVFSKPTPTISMTTEPESNSASAS